MAPYLLRGAGAACGGLIEDGAQIPGRKGVGDVVVAHVGDEDGEHSDRPGRPAVYGTGGSPGKTRPSIS